jgi:hypothetical protein
LRVLLLKHYISNKERERNEPRDKRTAGEHSERRKANERGESSELLEFFTSCADCLVSSSRLLP